MPLLNEIPEADGAAISVVVDWGLLSNLRGEMEDGEEVLGGGLNLWVDTFERKIQLELKKKEEKNYHLACIPVQWLTLSLWW